jgi:hypothetical protein
MHSRTRGGRRLGQGCLTAGLVLGLISAAMAQDPMAQDRQAAPANGRSAAVVAEVTNDRLTLRSEGAPLGRGAARDRRRGRPRGGAARRVGDAG